MTLAYGFELPILILIINLAIRLNFLKAIDRKWLNLVDVSGHRTAIIQGSDDILLLFLDLFCVFIIWKVIL